MQTRLAAGIAAADGSHGETNSLTYHGILLVMYLLPIVVLAEEIALPIDHGIEVLHAPAALGGFLVAALILSPESLSATRAALANDLQRSINILLGLRAGVDRADHSGGSDHRLGDRQNGGSGARSRPIRSCWY